jgi:hypothetical protein
MAKLGEHPLDCRLADDNGALPVAPGSRVIDGSSLNRISSQSDRQSPCTIVSADFRKLVERVNQIGGLAQRMLWRVIDVTLV